MRPYLSLVLGFLAVPLVASSFLSAADSSGYLRQPDLHGSRVVFTAEGDLWTARVDGGPARRLTAHPGREIYASYSPDGRTIAFTGQYQGNYDVFLLPADGGEPRRLTWHPSPDIVIGWTPDGSHVLFRSNRRHPHGSWELFSVPTAGGDVEPLPLGWAARIAVEEGTGRYAFNRVSRETRTWKRYRGGTASDIWVGHPDRADYRKVTEFDGADAFPMWHGGRIWFLSDQGGTANLWSMKPDGSDRRRHTRESRWDVRWPAMGNDGRIVYQLGADLHLFDPTAGRSRMLDIRLPSDRVLTRRRYSDPQQYITWFDLSPDGERVLVTARGELYSVPVEKGVTLRLTDGTGARERRATYGPEGDRIVYISDELGEEALMTRDAWGRGEARVAKAPAESGWHFPPHWSPDGERLAWGDEGFALFVMTLKGGKTVEVDRSPQEEITQYAWSPGGRWLAYSRANRADFSSIYLYDTRSGKTHRVTGEDTHDHSPAWDPEGRYLYFLSDRHMNPYLGWRDFETIEFKTTRPYLVLLREDVQNPFAEQAGLPEDEEGEDRRDKGRKDGDEPEEQKSEPVEIDLEGLPDRLVALPTEAGVYGSLAATGGKVFYVSSPPQGMADNPGLFTEEGPRNELIAFDLDKKKAETFVAGISGYVLAPKAGKVAFQKKKGELYVVDAGSKPGDLGESRVDLSGMVLELDPRAEWRQIYYEGWRLMRDFHWDEDLGGLDWKAVRDRYAALLPRLGTRNDLRDLLGELIGELATSHTYVWGGDLGETPDAHATGLLGADVERRAGRDGEGYVVTRIYRGAPADDERSPLQEPEVDVREGDIIFAVNHRPFPEGQPFEAAFENLASRRVVLTVNDRSRRGARRDVVVTPLSNDRSLRYADWVRRNRERVDEATEGRMGYIHIPDMGSAGMIEFDTWFYPQIKKKGMVVDVRWNGGGFVSQLILERFRRKVVSWDRSAGGGVFTYPWRVLHGPFVVLTNEFAGSDGDIFPQAVQLEGLAPVIGQRSWGGVVGIRADKPLQDAGMLTQPEYAWWDPSDGWGLENRGVIPDIEVQNRPQDLAAGRDPQLARAIEEVERLRREGSWPEPDFSDQPIKTRESFLDELP